MSYSVFTIANHLDAKEKELGKPDCSLLKLLKPVYFAHG